MDLMETRIYDFLNTNREYTYEIPKNTIPMKTKSPILDSEPKELVSMKNTLNAAMIKRANE
nr:hypothetical protein [uncultured Helicobacter sp.]